MSKTLDELHAELNRRHDLVEYFTLRMLEQNIESVSYLALTSLHILNPKNNYRDKQYVQDRMNELNNMYFDETGRMKEF